MESGSGLTNAASASAETAPVNDWVSMFGCCVNTAARKAVASGSIFQSASSGVRKRILVLGKSETGKSRTLAILQKPTTPVDSSQEYPPTNGTSTCHVDIGPISYTFIEVGGALVEFWSRSIDSKTDGIWYLIDKEDYDRDDFAALEKFLGDSRDILLKRKPALVVTILGVGKSASTSEIEILINASGAIEPKKLGITRLEDPLNYASILKSVEVLKTKVIQ